MSEFRKKKQKDKKNINKAIINHGESNTIGLTLGTSQRLRSQMSFLCMAVQAKFKKVLNLGPEGKIHKVKYQFPLKINASHTADVVFQQYMEGLSMSKPKKCQR